MKPEVTNFLQSVFLNNEVGFFCFLFLNNQIPFLYNKGVRALLAENRLWDN